MKNQIKKSKIVVQTTGHSWDGDIQEFNNPLPTWWLWGFYASALFTIIYWILYPSWPIAGNYLKGSFNEIEYITPDGKSHRSHWNTRALFLKEMQQARAAQQKYITLVNRLSYTVIINDQHLSEFIYSKAKVLFADNCAPCHQVGGGGVIGSYPNLVDDSWLWGGSFIDIQKSIEHGQRGYMPAFSSSLSETQLHDIASYVLSLSFTSDEQNSKMIHKGSKLFNSQIGGCYYCHGILATGIKNTGAANLTDSIWTIANIPATGNYQQKLMRVKKVIANGVQRDMPAWSERLSVAEIKILSIYVHQLGGGE